MYPAHAQQDYQGGYSLRLGCGLCRYVDGDYCLLFLCDVGGIFVVIVGVYIFFQNPVPQIRRNRAGNTTLWKDFASMFGFTIANFVVVIPYILAFFAMFGVGTAAEGKDVASVLTGVFIILGFLGGASAWWTGLTSVISLFRRRFRPRHLLTINHVAGIIVGLLGIYTILSTFISRIDV